MTLTFHPAKDRPKVAAGLAFGFGILLQTLWQWVAPPVALTLWVVLLFSLRDFFLPTNYRFEQDSLSISGPLKGHKSFPWRRFRCFVKDRNGLFLSPYRKKRTSENYRGVFLPLSREQREEALKVLSEKGVEERNAA